MTVAALKRLGAVRGPVNPPQPPAAPTITNFTATPSTITLGSAVVFNATVTDTTSLTLNGNAVTLPITLVPGPAGVIAYTLIATGAGGAASASLNVTVNAPVVVGGVVNVAKASNGSVATATSTYSGAFPASSTIDGDRTGIAWGNKGGWNSAGGGGTHIVTIRFKIQQTINKIIVCTLQDNYAQGVDPPDDLAFSLFGVTDAIVQYDNGTDWITLNTYTANNLVKKTITFPSVTTTGIRVAPTAYLALYARLVEIEAWTASSVNPVPALIDVTSPAVGFVVTRGNPVQIRATVTPVTETGGTLSKVEIFRDGATTPLFSHLTTTTYSLSYDDTTAASGVHSYRVVVYDANGIAGDVVVTGRVIDPPVGAWNWAARGAAATVMYRPLQSDSLNDANLSGRQGDVCGVWSIDGGLTFPVIDTDIHPPALTGSLKFTIPPGGGPNTARDFFTNYGYGSDPATCKRYGPNSDYWTAITIRWDDNLFNTLFLNIFGGLQLGIKFCDHTGGDEGRSADQSIGTSQRGKSVWQTWHQIRYPHHYDYDPFSGSTRVWQDFHSELSDYDNQPGKEDGIVCSYLATNASEATDNHVPVSCKGITANDWITFKFHRRLGPLQPDGTVLRALTIYMQKNIEPKFKVLDSARVSKLDSYQDQGARPQEGKLWLDPYITDKSSTQDHPVCHAYYCGAIVSDTEPLDLAEVPVVRPAYFNGSTIGVPFEIPNTAPVNYRATCKSSWDFGNATFTSNFFESYGTFALDAETGIAYFQGLGGHVIPSLDNGGVSIDFLDDAPGYVKYQDSFNWLAAGIDVASFIGSYLPDGSMAPPHIFDAMHVVKRADGTKFLFWPYQQASNYKGVWWQNGHVYVLSSPTLAPGWIPFSGGTQPYPGGGTLANRAISAIDPRDYKIYFAGNDAWFYSWNPETRGYTSVGQFNSAGVAGQGACIDTIRNSFVVNWALDSPQKPAFHIRNITTGATTYLPIIGPDAGNVRDENYSAIVHVPKHDKYYVCSPQDNGNVMRLSLVEPTTGLLTPIADLPSPSNGFDESYTLKYLALTDALYFGCGFNNNIRCVRLS